MFQYIASIHKGIKNNEQVDVTDADDKLLKQSDLKPVDDAKKNFLNLAINNLENQENKSLNDFKSIAKNINSVEGDKPYQFLLMNAIKNEVFLNTFAKIFENDHSEESQVLINKINDLKDENTLISIKQVANHLGVLDNALNQDLIMDNSMSVDLFITMLKDKAENLYEESITHFPESFDSLGSYGNEITTTSFNKGQLEDLVLARAFIEVLAELEVDNSQLLKENDAKVNGFLFQLVGLGKYVDHDQNLNTLDLGSNKLANLSERLKQFVKDNSLTEDGKLPTNIDKVNLLKHLVVKYILDDIGELAESNLLEDLGKMQKINQDEFKLNANKFEARYRGVETLEEDRSTPEATFAQPVKVTRPLNNTPEEEKHFIETIGKAL